MHITKLKIKNFKRFKDEFTLELNSGLNILVGNNAAGKSTILEAIHLALTGIYNGRYLKNDITQYIFNRETVKEYIDNIKATDKVAILPEVLIELYFEGEDLAYFEGNNNSEKISKAGISFRIGFDERYKPEYQTLVENEEIKTLPIEYYEIYWRAFSRDSVTSRTIPIKSAMIDSSSNKFQNGSDMYVSRIVKENLDPNEIVSVSQAHRKMRDYFMSDSSIQSINQKIRAYSSLSNKELSLSVELLSKNAWENSLMTYLDDIPFHFIGKGEQSILKTELALSHKKTKQANTLLIEEPENHLSHTKLNQLINRIKDEQQDKQIIISTHSSFVANKLGLDNLVLLNKNETLRLDQLKEDTKEFFEKISGYDTLRMLLCNKAILVEGDSDELIIQKAYMMNNNNRLPIEDEIDVISVGISFLRFLEIAEKVSIPVVVVTDNDGNIKALEKKYEDFLNDGYSGNVKICYDKTIDVGDLMIGDKKFNYNTLEPKIVKANDYDLTALNEIFETKFKHINDLHLYMKRNKTECALKIFKAKDQIKLPEYLLEAIK